MIRISYQLYSSRSVANLGEVLTLLAQLGFERVEGYGALFENDRAVAELKAQLGANGLAMPTGHFGIEMLETAPERVVEIARSLGIQTVYCPFLSTARRPDSGAGYVAFGKRLQQLSQSLRDAGLGFGWHNHDFELRALADGAVPIEALFEGGPDLEWEADIAWVIKGGGDPYHWIETLGSRITAVHMKDIAPAGQNRLEDGWADLGQGTVDWAGLMAALRDTPARHFILEHDNPSDPARYATRSMAAAQQLAREAGRPREGGLQ